MTQENINRKGREKAMEDYQSGASQKKRRVSHVKRIICLGLIVILGFVYVARLYLNYALFEAAGSDNFREMQLLVRFGANVNYVNRRGLTPLMRAAFYAYNSNTNDNPNFDVLALLLDEGADVNAADVSGKTPLMFTARGGNSNPDVLRILIENGANVGVKDTDGKNALDHAESNRKLRGTEAYNLLREKTLSATR